MKVYDITQPVLGCIVYLDDPKPEITKVLDMKKGDPYNMSSFSMGAHNGTHVDAPLHFIDGGKSIGEICPDRFVGAAYVTEFDGELGADDAGLILEKAAAASSGSEKRILIKGNAVVSAAAAEVFAVAGTYLVGNESQSVGPIESPMEVHRILLGTETVLLEGIRLAEVPEGAYILSCAPINLGPAEGAPCRAVLIEL